MDKFEYRIGPGSGEWISYPELVKLLRSWDGVPKETGLPSITISKRVKGDDQGALLAQRLRELMAAEEADSGKCDCGNAGCAELYYDDELD